MLTEKQADAMDKVARFSVAGLDDYTYGIFRFLVTEGYDNFIHVEGEFGASELCLHCGVYGLKALFAMANKWRTHAYVCYLDKEGRTQVIDGSFYQFEDMTFSLS